MRYISFFALLFVGLLCPTNSNAALYRIECSNILLSVRADKSSESKIVYFGEKFHGIEPLEFKKFLHKPDTEEEYIPDLYPAYGGRNVLEPILKVTHADGSQTVELLLDSVTQDKVSANITKTVFHFKDKVYPLYIKTIFYAYWKENVITEHTEIYSKEKTVQLERFYSSYLPISEKEYFLCHFNGTWANEMQRNETKLNQGVYSIESKKGVRATQSDSPSFMLGIDGAPQITSGKVILGSLAWSGNFKLNFEVDETNTLNILAGVNSFGSYYTLDCNETFVTPKMIWTYSSAGYAAASRNLHDWCRNYQIYGGAQLGKIVLNSWEGAYFNYNEDTILKMIDNAADMGAELFVLDDGWFGNEYPRNSDDQGLGDWEVNNQKLPHGISYLADYTTSKGLKFGIWIEPEMVNPKSKLAQTHPDWIVKGPKRDIPTLRNQWLLDLSNPEVQNFVYNTFKQVLGLSKNISYIKWDANRHVESFGSSFLKTQSHFWIDYVKGLYHVYDRIRQEYLNIEIQLCASGGGRVDYGALAYHNEFWPSDNTDPYSRMKIQYNTNIFFPAKATAAHVSVSPNHQSSESSPLKLRMDVAMMGRFGIELQPSNLTTEELQFLKKGIQQYKEVRHIIQLGDWYPISSPHSSDMYPGILYVSKDKSEALFFGFSSTYHPRTSMPNFKLNGLDTNIQYRVSELNQHDGGIGFWGNGYTFTGDYLKNVGVNPYLQKRGESVVLYLKAIK